MPKDAKGSRFSECPAKEGQLYVSVRDSRVEQHVGQHDHVSTSLRPSVHLNYLATALIDVVVQYTHLSHCTPGPGTKTIQNSQVHVQSQSHHFAVIPAKIYDRGILVLEVEPFSDFQHVRLPWLLRFLQRPPHCLENWQLDALHQRRARWFHNVAQSTTCLG